MRVPELPQATRLSSSDQARVRSAMLSVYYQASARTYRVSGAPAVVLPPEEQLDSLGEALGVVQRLDPGRMREALWLVVRNVRVRGVHDDPLERYDEAAADFLAPNDRPRLRRLAALRRAYRSRGNVLGAVLTACRDRDYDQLPGLVAAYDQFGALDSGTEEASVHEMTLGEVAREFLDLAGRTGAEPRQLDAYRHQVHALEHDVGRPISEYVTDLAAAAAFRDYCDGLDDPMLASSGPLTIHPVSLAVSQDRASLTTTAVVSTYATGPFSSLELGTAPQYWAHTSDVIKKATYIRGPYDFTALGDTVAEKRLKNRETVMLDEHAAVAWGRDGEAQSEFHNVLAIDRTILPQEKWSARSPEPAITIDYRLSRSVESQVLWDRRSGGMDLNEGYYRVWALGENRWRISVRKHLRFTDRTPSDSSPQDLGQALNYLAPASITWWLETETYNLSRYPSAAGATPAGDGPGAGPEEENS